MLNLLRPLIIILILTITCTVASGQSSFQKNRKAFQKARFFQTSKRYGKACQIFEKKRTRGERKPFLNLGLGRKSKKRVAEQN